MHNEDTSCPWYLLCPEEEDHNWRPFSFESAGFLLGRVLCDIPARDRDRLSQERGDEKSGGCLMASA